MLHKYYQGFTRKSYSAFPAVHESTCVLIKDDRSCEKGHSECSAVQCRAVQCSAVQCSEVQCSVEQCRAPLHFNIAQCCRRRSRDQTSQPSGAWASRIYWGELMEKQIQINKKINISIYHFNEQNFS